MKVLYEPGEITSIEKSVEILKDNGCGCLFEENNPDRLYGLTFKVKNPALAQYILLWAVCPPTHDQFLSVLWKEIAG